MEPIKNILRCSQWKRIINKSKAGSGKANKMLTTDPKVKKMLKRIQSHKNNGKN